MTPKQYDKHQKNMAHLALVRCGLSTIINQESYILKISENKQKQIKKC